MTFIPLALFSILTMAMKLSSPDTASNCSNGNVVPDLQAWVSPIPIVQNNALPPGAPQAPNPEPTDHTHVLHVELRLHNTTRNPHNAEVLGASWSQNGQPHPLRWHKQPDLSPLNRFNTIEHRPIQTNTTNPITVTMQLMVDGQACMLETTTDVPVRR